MRPCMEYCCHVWAGAASCYLELVDKLQKRICRTAGISLSTPLESPKCSQLRKCSSELAQLVPLPFSRGRSTRYSYRLHDFSAMIPRCYKDPYVNSFFCRRARLWDFLPIKWFPLTYNQNGFMSRINIHLLTVGSFSRDFLYALIFLCFFSL